MKKKERSLNNMKKKYTTTIFIDDNKPFNIDFKGNSEEEVRNSLANFFINLKKSQNKYCEVYVDVKKKRGK